MLKRIGILIILSFFSCSSGTENSRRPDTGIKPDSLLNFLKICESDLKRAVHVVRQNELTALLRHFQEMNDGGKKYYILEKHTITKMINSVTKGMYEDFILINGDGIVVYTKNDDSIFSSSVYKSLSTTPLSECFKNREKKIYIIDEPGKSAKDRLVLYVSAPVIIDDMPAGIFILKVNTARIESLLSYNTTLTDIKGRYYVTHSDTSRTMEFPSFDTASRTSLTGGKRILMKLRERNLLCYPIRYHNLTWVVISH